MQLLTPGCPSLDGPCGNTGNTGLVSANSVVLDDNLRFWVFCSLQPTIVNYVIKYIRKYQAFTLK